MYLMSTTEPEDKHSLEFQTPTYATGWYTQHWTISVKVRLRFMKIGHVSQIIRGDGTQKDVSFVATTV